MMVAFVLSVFSIASNTLLLKKKDLKKTEENFALVSLLGSVIILVASIYFGYQSRGAARNVVANRMMTAAGYIRNPQSGTVAGYPAGYNSTF